MDPAYSPLGRGFLAGLFRDLTETSENDNRRRSPRFHPDHFESNIKLLAQIETLAKKKSATLARISLAWLMAQGGDIIPMPGAKSRVHLQEDVKAI